MGNYSSKLFNNSIFNELKVKENTHLEQMLHTTSETLPQNGEKADVPSENDGIVQTPMKKNSAFDTRKRTNAIPDYLQNDKTRKPYLETDLDSVSSTGKFCLDPRSPNVEYPRTPILMQHFPSVSTKNIDGENLFQFNLQPLEAQSKPMNLDPRSPAIEFDRTPISATKISKQFQCTDNMKRLEKSSSSLDICIKLSYCESTSLFNIPEIQALPDIVVSLRRSCSLKENLNEKSSSLTNGDIPLDSASVSDDVKSMKLHVSKENPIPNDQEEIASAEYVNTENDETEMKEHCAKENCTNIVSQNPLPRKNIETVDKASASDPEEKFKVWRDSCSKLPEYSVNANNSQRNSSLPDKEEVLIEFDDCSIMNNITSNPTKKMDKTEESVQEKKVKCVDKKYIDIKKENKLEHENKLFSPEFKTAPEFSKIRTPFSNRSNNNGLIQSLSSKSPQQFLGHRKLFVSENKNLQENTPPAHKKRVKNIPTKLNNTQWDSDSTIII